MLIEKEPENTSEVNPDIFEVAFEETLILEEDELPANPTGDEEEFLDIPFQANDEGYW